MSQTPGQPKGPEEDAQGGQPPVPNRESGVSRRGLGVLGVAAVVVTGATVAAINNDVADVVTGALAGMKSPEKEKPKEKLTLAQIRERLVKKYGDALLLEVGVPGKKKKSATPSTKIRNFRPLALKASYEKDDLVHSYFLQATYADLLADRVILPNDLVEELSYLNPDKMWQRKLSIVTPNHKKDCEEAYENCKPFKTGDIRLQSYYAICRKAEKRVKSKAKAQGLDSKFMDAIDADFLLGISIHEVMPAGLTSTTRICLFKTLLEEGMEPNKIPAVFDNVASFGVMQMTTMPYEGRKRKHPYTSDGAEGDIEPYLSDFGLPEKLHDCVGLEDQLVAGMLLLLQNMKWFEHKLVKNVRFMNMWKDASLLDRRAFLATILGTAHNNPRNALKSIDQAIIWTGKHSADSFVAGGVQNLAQLRGAYVAIAKGGHSVSGRHGDLTGKLVQEFSRYSIDSEPVDEKPTKPDEPVAPKKQTILLVREREGEKYYTFTVPSWTLKELITRLCGTYTAELEAKIKTFNDVEKFAPEDVIFMPVDLLKPELRSNEIQEYEVPEGANAKAFIEKVTGGNKENAKLAVLYSSVSSMDELNGAGVIRLPKGVVKVK